MKNTISLILTISFLILSSCSKDECSGVNCSNNGNCESGKCECLTGYSGNHCENQVTPIKIKIKNIKVTKFPATDNGAGWDLTSGPDIYIALIYNQSIIYKHSTFYKDANPNNIYDFNPDINLYFKNPIDEYSLILYDYDSFDEDDFMGGVTFTPYFSTNNFPKVLYIDAGGDVSFEVSINYIF